MPYSSLAVEAVVLPLRAPTAETGASDGVIMAFEPHVETRDVAVLVCAGDGQCGFDAAALRVPDGRGPVGRAWRDEDPFAARVIWVVVHGQKRAGVFVAADDRLGYVGGQLVVHADTGDAVFVVVGQFEAFEHAFVGERAHAFLRPADRVADFASEVALHGYLQVIEALFGVVERAAQQVARVLVFPDLEQCAGHVQIVLVHAADAGRDADRPGKRGRGCCLLHQIITFCFLSGSRLVMVSP